MKYVIFSHGKEGTPDGGKIVAMSNVALSLGWKTKSIDYRGIYDPHERVKKLINNIPKDYDLLVLVGSSMGGYVSLVGGKMLEKVDGVFLLAPAIGMRNLEYREKEPVLKDCFVEIVHGYNDEIISVETIYNYSKKFGVSLHLFEDSHRLLNSIDKISELFHYFLKRVERGV